MIINSFKNKHKFILEDKEDLIHFRPILHGSTVEISRKIHKKQEEKVKRKQEIEWEVFKMEKISSKISGEKLIIKGISPKGERVVSLSPGEELIIYKIFSDLELDLINVLVQKKILHIGVDGDTICVGEILLNRYKILHQKYYSLKEQNFELNTIVKNILKKYCIEKNYFKISYKICNTLKNIIEGDFWELSEDPLNWRNESIYLQKNKDLVDLYLTKKENFIKDVDIIRQKILEQNVYKIYINENTTDDIIEMIFLNNLEKKTVYLPKNNSINWILDGNVCLVSYF